MAGYVNRDPGTCVRKKRYASFHKAIRAARLIYHDTGDVTHAFACSLCRGAHVGGVLDDTPKPRIPRVDPTVRSELDELGIEIATVYPID